MDLGLPASMDSDRIVRTLQNLERRVSSIEGSASNLLVPAGIRARQAAVTFEKPVIVDGSLRTNGDMTATGALRIEGPATIAGTLSLPNGIIDNAALASPIEVGQASAAETGFGTALTDQDRAVTTIPVPAGYTRALVMCVVTAGVMNSAASIDFLFLSASVNGLKSRELYSQAPAGGAAPPITTSKSSLLTGLSGGSITVAAAIHTQGNPWAANPSSRAYVEAQAIFLR